MQDYSQDNCYGLGLGLGLPSTFSSRQSSSVKDAHQYNIPCNMLFPFNTQSRHTSEATVKLDNLVSYWSPFSEDGQDCELEQQEEIEDEDEDDEQELSVQEPISTALEWAWLLPMLGRSALFLVWRETPLTIPSHADTTTKQEATADVKSVASSSSSPAHAPAMLHMPSIESINSSVGFYSSDDEYLPSVATSSYQSDMARSQSLLSSFSIASFSTAASSIASTSSSVLDRKRPLPSRAASSTANTAQVIKLRTRTYQRAVQGEVRAPSSLTRRDTKMSVVSQAASVHCSSPTLDELEDMVFEPMQQLPSPSMSFAQLESTHCFCDNEIGVNSIQLANEYDPCAALFEIWNAAETAERQRKLQKKKPVKSSRLTGADSSAKRVQRWVHKLKSNASKQENLNAGVEEELRPEELLEPQEARKSIKGIEQVLQSASVKAGPKQAAPIWDFLG